MTASMCRLVPLASLALPLALVAACADSHGTSADGGAPDAFLPDATFIPADGSVPADGSAPRDSSLLPPDAGSCTPRAIDFACTDRGNGAFPAGEAFDLPVYLGSSTSCLCGEQIGCSATVVGSTIELTTSQCSDLLCDGCFRSVAGRCSIPALSPGLYRVRVDGTDAMELHATNDTPAVGPVDRCLTVPDDHGCGFDWVPRVEEVDQLCFPSSGVSGAPMFVRVQASVDCGAIPTCEVERTAAQLLVTYRTFPTRCDIDCGPGAFPVEILVRAAAARARRLHDSTGTVSSMFVVTADGPLGEDGCVARTTTASP